MSNIQKKLKFFLCWFLVFNVVFHNTGFLLVEAQSVGLEAPLCPGEKAYRDGFYDSLEEAIFYENMDYSEYARLVSIRERVNDIPYWDAQSRKAFVIPAAKPVVRAAANGVWQVRQTLANGSFKWITVRNGHLRNKIHTSGIRFDSQGFPVFTSKHNFTLANNDLKASNATQFSRANANLRAAYNRSPSSFNNRFSSKQIADIRNGVTPRGHIWHHHQDRGRLQLVTQPPHGATGHTGGRAIWGTR